MIRPNENDATAARPSTIPWPPLLLVAAAAGGWLLGKLVPIAWPGVDDAAGQLVGYGFGVAGVGLMIWSAATLAAAHTTVRPDRGADALVTHGPFARLRNPIYVADVLLLLFLAEMTKNVWLVATAAAFAVLVTRLAILPEERHLEARFGDAYRAYKERTRRWL